MQRGNERKPIFIDDADRQRFLRMLAEMADRFGLLIHAFVLMLNHYHLLIEAPEGGLSAGMQWLNGSYSQYFNWRHDRVGHLFQGRFHSVTVLDERYFVTVSRYIHLNPVKAGIVEKPWDYAWSSCAYFLGNRSAPEWLQTGRTLDFFGGDPLAYRAFLEEGEDDLVAEAVARDISKDASEDDAMPGCPMLQMKTEAAVAAIGYEVSDRRSLGNGMVIYLLHAQGIKQAELARLTGISRAAINQRISRIETQASKQPKLAEALSFLKGRLMGQS